MKNNRFISDIITVVLFLAVIFGFATAFVVMPDEEEHSYEVDVQTFPEANKETVMHGTFATDMDKYFCDQFPLRKDFITVKALAEKYSWRAVNNGVLAVTANRGEFNKVDYFVATRFNAVGVGSDTEFYSKEHVESTLGALKDVLDQQTVPVDVILPPRKIDVIGPTIGYPTYTGDMLNAQAKEILGDYYVDVMGTLRARMDENMQPYFATDHHWTPVGAFYAYEAYANKAFGTNPQFESYDYIPAKLDFVGTSARGGNYFYYGGEVMDSVWFDNYHLLEVEMGDSFAKMKYVGGLYNEDALNSADPFNYYIHGKSKYVRITMPGEERETIMVAKDSFAHVFVPHLLKDYNVVMVDIDLFNYGFSLSTEAEKVGAARILVMYNFENIITKDQISKLRK